MDLRGAGNRPGSRQQDAREPPDVSLLSLLCSSRGARRRQSRSTSAVGGELSWEAEVMQRGAVMADAPFMGCPSTPSSVLAAAPAGERRGSPRKPPQQLDCALVRHHRESQGGLDCRAGPHRWLADGPHQQYARQLRAAA